MSASSLTTAATARGILGRYGLRHVLSPKAVSSRIPAIAAVQQHQTNQQQRWNSQLRVILIPEIPQDSEKDNPIMTSVKGDGLPALSQVKERDIYFGLGKALLDYEAVMVEVETLAEEGVRDFKRLLEPLEKAKVQFESVWHCANMLQLVTDSLEKDRFVRLHLRAEKASLARVESRPFYQALKDMKSRQLESSDFLSSDEERIVDRYLLEYRHQGFELEDKKYQELTGMWTKKLSDNLAEYKFRHGRSTERFKHVIRDPNVVREFPVDVLKAMASDSAQPTRGPWTVTLHPYIHKQVMSYCPDRNVRWTTHLGDVTRGSKGSDVYLALGNYCKEIRQHRLDQALTLGYKNYAEFSMETKMATSVENVQTMISTLQSKAKHHQEMELESLQNFAESRGFEEDIEVWDVEFFRRKQKRFILGVTDEELREYFPLPKVLAGIFKLCSSLFGVSIEEVKVSDEAKVEASLWHPEVKMFRAIDTSSGQELGRFYIDPYIRDDKGYAGGDKGWYVPVRARSGPAGCSPLGVFVLSLPVPSYGKPSLLNMAEVEELLRNFGNMMGHLCATNSQWSDLTGKAGLEWDVLDLPGFFMQHWLYVPEVMRTLSGHWSSDKPLDPELVGKLCTVPRQLLAGYDLCHSLYKSAYDIAFYTEDYEKESYQDMAERMHSDFLLLPTVSGDMFPAYVSDMFSGDYPAAMFCSTWAKMLAADAFSAVQEAMDPVVDAGSDNKSLFNNEQVKRVTMRYRNTVLAAGSAKATADTFRAFRGRDPSHEALLLNLGLKATPHPKKKGQQESL